MKFPKALCDTVDFSFGEKVYHAADCESWGFVTGIYFYPGEVKFLIQWGISSSCHYAFELTREKPIE